MLNLIQKYIASIAFYSRIIDLDIAAGIFRQNEGTLKVQVSITGTHIASKAGFISTNWNSDFYHSWHFYDQRHSRSEKYHIDVVNVAVKYLEVCIGQI